MCGLALLILDYILKHKMPTGKQKNCCANDENFMQFMKENLQRITERLDSITVELQEIKCHLQVSDKYKHLEKLQKDTKIIRDSDQVLEPQTYVILQTLDDRRNDTKINSVYQQAETIEYQVKEKKY